MIQLKTTAEINNEMEQELLKMNNKDLKGLLMEIYDVLDWMPGDDKTTMGDFAMFQIEQIGAMFPGGEDEEV